MKKLFILAIVFLLNAPAFAHHSFAIYDFETQIPFDGIVEEIKFRNPHISMILKSVDASGEEILIEFIEGAPANMLVRSGLKPNMVKPGTKITAVGSPLLEDPTKFFLRIIKLESGEEFQ